MTRRINPLTLFSAVRRINVTPSDTKERRKGHNVKTPPWLFRGHARTRTLAQLDIVVIILKVWGGGDVTNNQTTPVSADTDSPYPIGINYPSDK